MNKVKYYKMFGKYDKNWSHRMVRETNPFQGHVIYNSCKNVHP